MLAFVVRQTVGDLFGDRAAGAAAHFVGARLPDATATLSSCRAALAGALAGVLAAGRDALRAAAGVAALGLAAAVLLAPVLWEIVR